MTPRKPGRYLAPLALVAVIVATALVVRAGLGTNHRATSTPAARATTTTRRLPRRAVYVIRPGDSLSSISLKTGISVTQLEALNPAVDPNALQAGQHLKLR